MIELTKFKKGYFYDNFFNFLFCVYKIIEIEKIKKKWILKIIFIA